MLPYLTIFLTAWVTALLLVPLARRLSFRWGILAEPGGRRQHTGRLPKLGGLPLLGAYLAGIFLIYLLLPPTEPGDIQRLRGVILGSVVITLGGLIDDRWELSPWPQFFIQFVGSLIAISHIIFIELFTDPFGRPEIWTWGSSSLLEGLFTVEGNLVKIWRPVALMLTVLWIVGIINAVNWFDGLDGLAAGVGTIALLLFAWHSYRLEQTTVAAFPLALAGALLGFLPFNFAPAGLFLGTAGVFLLGYNLATLSILSPAKFSTVLLVLAVPILDSAWLVVDRLRHGHNPFQGDRGHLHFRLSDAGLGTRRIVLGYYIVAAVFGLVAIVAPSGLVKLVTWLMLGTAVLGLLIWLSRSPQKTQAE